MNGKYVNSCMDNMDFTDGHVWHVYHSYELVDSSAGGTLTGTVKSFNSTTAPVTVQLFRSGSSSAAYNTTVKGNSTSYTISGISPGNYTVKVSKKNHVTREDKITVGAQAVTQNAQIHLKGDVTMDGAVNIGDSQRLFEHLQGSTIIDEYQLALAEVTGDGMVNIGDSQRLFEHLQGVSSLF